MHELVNRKGQTLDGILKDNIQCIQKQIIWTKRIIASGITFKLHCLHETKLVHFNVGAVFICLDIVSILDNGDYTTCRCSDVTITDFVVVIQSVSHKVTNQHFKILQCHNFTYCKF